MSEARVENIPRGISLRVESGFYAGLEWPLDRSATVVGRGRDADLVLSEVTISRAHAVFGFEQGHLFVQDLGSTNGTLLNDEQTTKALLSDRDRLQMGKLVLVVSLPSHSVKGDAVGDERLD